MGGSTTEPMAIGIEDDVFIGMRSIILKGVTIGTGSAIGAGNPARVVSELN